MTITESDGAGGGIESPPVSLTDFLLARIAEDEQRIRVRMTDGSLPPRDHPLMARGDARVLAECEAKRRIVALHEPDDYQDGRYCGHCDQRVPCPDIRILAGTYADHPDYCEEWKP